MSEKLTRNEVEAHVQQLSRTHGVDAPAVHWTGRNQDACYSNRRGQALIRIDPAVLEHPDYCRWLLAHELGHHVTALAPGWSPQRRAVSVVAAGFAVTLVATTGTARAALSLTPSVALMCSLITFLLILRCLRQEERVADAWAARAGYSYAALTHFPFPEPFPWLPTPLRTHPHRRDRIALTRRTGR